MSKKAKLFFGLLIFSQVLVVISSFDNNIITLFILLLLNILFWILLVISYIYILEFPKDLLKLKYKAAQWFVILTLSVYVLGLGISAVFLSRFYLDQPLGGKDYQIICESQTNKNCLDPKIEIAPSRYQYLDKLSGGNFSWILISIGFLLPSPFIYLLAKHLNFKNKLLPAILIPLLFILGNFVVSKISG